MSFQAGHTISLQERIASLNNAGQSSSRESSPNRTLQDLISKDAGEITSDQAEPLRNEPLNKSSPAVSDEKPSNAPSPVSSFSITRHTDAVKSKQERERVALEMLIREREEEERRKEREKKLFAEKREQERREREERLRQRDAERSRVRVIGDQSSAESELPAESSTVSRNVSVVSTFGGRSKFKHVFGEGTRKEACVVGVRPALLGNSGSPIKANPLFTAIPWAGCGGNTSSLSRLLICPTETPDGLRLPEDVELIPFLEYSSASLSDFDFCPFLDDLIATCHENGKVNVWKIGAQGLNSTITENHPESFTNVGGHRTKALTANFHPRVESLLASSGQTDILFWDLNLSKECHSVTTGNTEGIQNISWNSTGSCFATSGRDKILRIVDFRTNGLVKDSQISIEQVHTGAIGFKAVWEGLEKDSLITVGANDLGEREVKRWDLRKMSQGLNTNAEYCSKCTIDRGAGIMQPFLDNDIGVLYIHGRGDGNVYLFATSKEMTYGEGDRNQQGEEITFLTDYSSSIPAHGMANLPKERSVNAMKCEIARFVRLTEAGIVEPLSFIVPRTRIQYFQDDLYPNDTTIKSSQPTTGVRGWLEKKGDLSDSVLTFADLQPSGTTKVSDAPSLQTGPKYSLEDEMAKGEEEFTPDKFLKGYYSVIGLHGENEEQELEQDLMEGVSDSEWDDY